MTDCYLRRTSQEEQQLYDHLLYCVQTESPQAIIERFRRLFITTRDYQVPEIRNALDAIVIAKNAEDNFKLVLNRCCHIPINRWQMQSTTQAAIPALVSLFAETLPPGSVYSRSARRTRQLVGQFKDSEQYLTLQRLAHVVESNLNPKLKFDRGDRTIGNLIDRYPYLYEHCLLSEDSSYEHQQTVRQIKTQIQRRFELNLSKYVTYQVRLAQTARSQQPPSRDRALQPVANPTLLSDRELGAALREFVGRVQGPYTHRDLAHNFLSQSIKTSSYRAFKDELYEYLLGSMDSQYHQLQFNDKLYDYLKNTLTRYDSQKPSEFLLLRTSSKLLNFLVVDSPQRPDHYIFVDMIANMGATPTVLLLLKIALLCRQVKPHLEKRFSILFNHYEAASGDGVPWLIKSMENVHLALSVHFGSMDVSCLKQLM
ncbi:MAG: hypothetical protein SAJ12_11485 [Jaaginema sp. PMC 1079.18]|nr:hypothetical protein [Jaaginema sp. PMC 1080.18]MEC4851626.1 hypothetical protein [Jaaginema sp. PMC 1079.18]MEC4867550.1 hypothetical protein [Jaaginema sp. PMC 1078.18]